MKLLRTISDIPVVIYQKTAIALAYVKGYIKGK
jgi:hypothetical protein